MAWFISAGPGTSPAAADLTGWTPSAREEPLGIVANLVGATEETSYDQG